MTPAARNHALRDLIARVPARRQLGAAVGGIALGNVVREIISVPYIGQSLVLALAMTLTGLIYAPRIGVHARMGYLKHLPLLMGLDASLIALWIGSGVWFTIAPSPATVELAVSVVLWLCVLIVASITVQAARDKDLQQAHEVIAKCNSVKKMRRALKPLGRFWLFRWFDGLWEPIATPGLVSAFVAWTTALGLGSVAIANVPPALKQGIENRPAAIAIPAKLTPRAHKDAEHKKTGKAGRSNVPAHKAQPRKVTPAPKAKPQIHAQPLPYAKQCVGYGPIGAPAPPDQRQALWTLWLGPGVGVGASIGGCTDPAQEVKAAPGTWWAIGRCGSEIRSIGIVGADLSAALLIEQMAVFAEKQTSGGHLRGASDREYIGTGDFQIVHTDRGDYVGIRSQSGAGGADESKDPPSTCHDVADTDFRYTIVPPGLIDAWKTILVEGFAWPMAVGPNVTSTGATRKFAFREEPDSKRAVATATCEDDQTCHVRYRGVELPVRSSGTISDRLLSGVGPAAP